MLFVHGEQEKREHGKNHEKGRCCLRDAAFQEKEQGNAHGCRHAETHKLPLGKVQRNFGLYFRKVFGYCDIRHLLSSFLPAWGVV